MSRTLSSATVPNTPEVETNDLPMGTCATQPTSTGHALRLYAESATPEAIGVTKRDPRPYFR